MSPFEARQLAKLLRASRKKLALSASEVARRSGVDTATVTRLEQAQVPSPKPETLRAIARALAIPTADLFAVADWLPKDELPSFRPYLRTKYRELPPAAVKEIEDVFERLARDYGSHGPVDHEDEFA